MVALADAVGPEERLYVFGDIHGCREALDQLWARVEADLAAHPTEAWRLVLLGDYVDRGADNPGVLDWVGERLAEGRTTALLGNHDAMFLDAMESAESPSLEGWLTYGGMQTIASYGVLPPGTWEEWPATREQLLEAVPEAHRTLIAGLDRMHRAADYLFVHAGIDPDRAIEDQREEDLIWIRGPFLHSIADFGPVVVHGHTPVGEVEIYTHRIALDTGAVFGGELTCLVIDGTERRLFSVPGPPSARRRG
ncbi:MAG: metallophosphoesterase family protein [Pseudomonadota bacterium]